MDLMNIRRGLMSQMANAVKVKTGAFVGSGNIDQTITIGFEPDILIINCSSLDFETVGWLGQKNVIIVKNMITYQGRHNSATSTGANMSTSDNFGGDYPPYGKTNAYYTPYGIYQNGDMTISNGTRSVANSFVNGEIYDWMAIKL